MEQITWRRLDPFGQVTGDPVTTRSVAELETLATSGVEDVGTCTRKDDFRYYHHPTGRVVRCTVVTMTVPWGTYRYIPADATTLPPRRRSWGSSWRASS